MKMRQTKALEVEMMELKALGMEKLKGEVISDTPEQEESPTPEPTQHWDFTQEYAEGRVLTVLHEKEGLSSQMNRLMQELVNSGKLIQITEKYTKSDR